MAPFTPADLPSGCNTVEKVAMWAITALAHTNPTVQAIEGQGYSELAAQAGSFFVPASGKSRFLGRVSFELDPNHLAGGAKPWTFALALSDTALHANFKTN